MKGIDPFYSKLPSELRERARPEGARASEARNLEPAGSWQSFSMALTPEARRQCAPREPKNGIWRLPFSVFPYEIQLFPRGFEPGIHGFRGAGGRMGQGAKKSGFAGKTRNG